MTEYVTPLKPEDYAEIVETIAFMREHGVTSLKADGIEIVLSPQAPTTTPVRVVRAVDPAETDADGEPKRQRAAEAAHERMWRRITRSSGAPIPPFRGE